jgi:hypothetical protein
MRDCARCGEVKEESEFYSDKFSVDNIRSVCRQCDKEKSSSYYKDNMFAYRERARERYAKNKESCKKEIAKWREDNPERVQGFKDKYKSQETYKAQCKIIGLKLKFKELGCSIKHFIYYIESIMEEGMDWDGYKVTWRIVVPDTKDYRDFRVEKI